MKKIYASPRIIVLSLFIAGVCSSFIFLRSPGDSPLLPEGIPSPGKAMHLCIHLPSSISEPDFDTEYGGAMIKTGLDYLCSVSTGTVDILHATGDPGERSDGDYDCMIRLAFEPVKGEDLKLRETYRIKTIDNEPEVIEIKSGSARGLLYGLYRLGGMLESRQSLADLDIRSQPMVSHRVALLAPSSGFGKHLQPDMFWCSLREFPGLGLNGVFIVPAITHGTPAGMGTLPFRLSGSQVVAIEPEVSELRAVFRKIKAHGQDVYVLVSPILPPGFSPEEVRDYYDGKIKLEGYESAVTESMTAYLSTLVQTLPEIDGVVFHSLELGELWEGVSIFPCKDMSAGIRTLDAYMAALTNTCKETDKLPIFWTHVYGLNGSEVLQIRQALVGRDDLITLEDAYWPNGGWPFLPFMGYLPEDTREQVCSTTRLGIFLEATDGEYYGGGRLPVAWPVRHVIVVDEAVKNNAEMVFLRLNEHDETTHGTLFSTNAVMVEAAASHLWDPAPSLDDVWVESYSRLYGAAAAPQVVAEIERANCELTHIQLEELTRCFEDAQITLKAIGLLGEAAYRANLVLDNYADEVERGRGPEFMAVHYFITIQWQGKTVAGPSMPVTLRYIADNLTLK